MKKKQGGAAFQVIFSFVNSMLYFFDVMACFFKMQKL